MIEVVKNFYRGPRPKSFEELDKAGIKVVIDLESGAYEKFHDDAYEFEKPWEWGITKYEARLSDIWPPSYIKTRQIFNTIENHRYEGHPVYIHCLHGKDRTGFCVAYHRMIKSRWTFVNAVKEMFSFGFHKWPYIWWVPFLWFYMVYEHYLENRVQDLRDNERDQKEYIFNKRGWFPKWRWQLCVSRNPFKLYKLLAFDLRFTKTHGFFEGFSFGFFGIKFFFTLAQHDESACKSYGFYFDDGAFVVKWARDDWDDGGFIKFFHFPWAQSYSEHEFMDKSGKWTLPAGSDWKERDAFKVANQKTEAHSFRYVLKSGEIQDRVATITADRSTYWQLWFGLGKLKITPKRVKTSIWVTFNDEVGEGTGSWKGGTMGCGWDLKPGQTFEQALREMEKERKFGR